MISGYEFNVEGHVGNFCDSTKKLPLKPYGPVTEGRFYVSSVIPRHALPVMLHFIEDRPMETPYCAVIEDGTLEASIIINRSLVHNASGHNYRR